MSINKEKDVYLKDGKLDLSILNEDTPITIKETDQEIDRQPEQQANQEVRQEAYNTILEDLESMDLKNLDISATLQEMAMIFEEEDEYKKAFNKERLEDEMRQFGKKHL